MLEHVANHNINDAVVDSQCDSFRSGLDVMAYNFNVLDNDVKIFRFLLMCQPLVFFPSSFVIQAPYENEIRNLRILLIDFCI